MYYGTAYYDVIYYIYHRRKRHFGEILQSYKVINDVIIFVDVMRFLVIDLEHKFQLFVHIIK